MIDYSEHREVENRQAISQSINQKAVIFIFNGRYNHTFFYTY